MVSQMSSDDSYDDRVERGYNRRRGILRKPVRMCSENEDILMDNDDDDDDYADFLRSLTKKVDHIEAPDHPHRYVNNNNCKRSDCSVAVDPHYKMFMDHLTEDGKSYVLEINLNNTLVRVKYEGKNGLSDVHGSSRFQSEKPEKFKSRQERLTKDSTRVLRSASREKEADNPKLLRKDLSIKKTNVKPKVLKNVSRSGSKERPKKRSVPLEGSKKPPLVKEKQLKVINAKPISCREFISFSPRIVNPSEDLGGSDSESDTDDSYSTFLNHLTNDGEYMIFARSGRKIVKYEASSTSDSDSYGTDRIPSAGERNVSTINLESEDEDDDQGCRYSLFRKGLMEILKKPYDQKEYETLLKDVKHILPVTRERELRSGVDKTYVLHHSGKSYLDRHQGLAAKIDSVKACRPKILNLLRGFYYWLEKRPVEDSFCPWMDPVCLAVLPEVEH